GFCEQPRCGFVTVCRPAWRRSPGPGQAVSCEGEGVPMLRKFIRASLFATLGLMAVVLAYGASSASADDKKDEKVPTISEIMTKGHKGTDAYIAKIRAEAKAEKWDDAKEHAKTLAFFGENLGKNKPPKGDDKSWKTLTEKYAETT